MVNIKFTIVYEVAVGRGAYTDFIRDLRSRLADPNHPLTHGRPVLPPQQNTAAQIEWFEIVLQTDEPRQIRLLFRCDNVYLVAYQMENSNTWLEFGREGHSTRLVPGSTFLGFNCNYQGAHGIEVAAGGEGARSRIQLSRIALRNAVNNLAISTVWQVRAESALVVVQMIAEAVRFEDVQYFVLDSYFFGATPNERILALENNWGRISTALLRSDAYVPQPGQTPFFPLPFDASLNLSSAIQVAAAIAIVAFCIPAPPRGRRLLSSSSDLGLSLTEVFAVKINNIDNENPGDLYGTVTVTDGLISQYIYNRDRGNYESIRPGEKALLTGPAAAAISAMDSFVIDVALMDKDADLSPDDEISKGQIEWNMFNYNNQFDVAVYEEIHGAYGSATVIYAVLSNATQATIEVKLINGDGEDPADVYGTLFATNTTYSNDDFKIMLVNRPTSSQYVQVRPGQLIPLSRSILAVPLDSQLTIEANLFDYDFLPADDEIANGTATFTPQLTGTSQKDIFGKYGQIQVKVTWSP